MITTSVWGRHYEFMSHRPSPIVQDSAFPTVTVKDIEEEREGTRSEKDRVMVGQCALTPTIPTWLLPAASLNVF